MRKHRDRLLTEGVNRAARMIERNPLSPFAVAIESDGGLICMEAEDSAQPADDIRAALCSRLQTMARVGSIVASGIVSDVRLHDTLTSVDKDAIRVELDDADAPPVTCYVPYPAGIGAIDQTDVIAVVGGLSVF